LSWDLAVSQAGLNSCPPASASCVAGTTGVQHQALLAYTGCKRSLLAEMVRLKGTNMLNKNSSWSPVSEPGLEWEATWLWR
jgi:hypothetical protein